MALSDRLAKAGLTSEQSNALTAAVQNDPNAINGLVIALDGAPKMTLSRRRRPDPAIRPSSHLSGTDCLRGSHGSPAYRARRWTWPDRKSQLTSDGSRDRF